MKKYALTVCLALVLALGTAAAARAGTQAATDESLFREAKLLVFDKSWEAALDRIEELLDRFPASPLAGQALFYKGECLGALRGREREALRAYKAYIRLEDAKPSLVEESEGSIVDLAFDLYQGGDAQALREIESRLGHPNKVVRYYAAYKLSLVPDKKQAVKAAPVLSQIVETEKDPELLDRARIALLRVSPESLKTAEDGTPRTESTARMLQDPHPGRRPEGARLLAQHPVRPGRPGPERPGRGRQGGPPQEGLRRQQDHERAGQVEGEHPPHRRRGRHGLRDLDRLKDGRKEHRT